TAGRASGFTANETRDIYDTVTMPARSSITYKAIGELRSSATGILSNTANVAAPSGVTDSNLANNSATDSDTISVKADLKVTVNDGKTKVITGQKNTYTIVVTNLGPSDVIGAVMSDSFPAELSRMTLTGTKTVGPFGSTAS